MQDRLDPRLQGEQCVFCRGFTVTLPGLHKLPSITHFLCLFLLPYLAVVRVSKLSAFCQRKEGGDCIHMSIHLSMEVMRM